MRLRPRWIVALLVIFITPQVFLAVRARRDSVTLPDWIPERIHEESKKHIAFVLDTQRWLSFEIPHGTSHMRLLTNAGILPESLKTSALALAGPEWNYALDYVFEDDDESEIAGGTYHFKTRLDVLEDPDSNRLFFSRYYAETPSYPAATREMNVATSSIEKAPRLLKIRLQSDDPEVTCVTVRLLCLLERPESQQAYFWNRLSRKRRKQLAAGSVHSHLLLDDRAKSNLMRTIWRPLAPLGYQPVDYQQYTLFTLRDAQEFLIRVPPTKDGWTIAPNRHGMLRVPRGPGQLQLRITRVTDVSTTDVASADDAVAPKLRVHWFGSRAHQRSRRVVSLDSIETLWTTPIEGGLLELDSDISITVQAFWTADANLRPDDLPQAEQMEQADQASLDVTPEPTYLRTFVTTASQPVDYRIAHVGNRSTPVRVSLRVAQLPEEFPASQEPPASEKLLDPSSSVVVGWEYLDSTDQVVQTGEVAVDATWSVYDRVREDGSGSRVWEEGPGSRVSDPSDYHFTIPPGVDRLRLIAREKSVLVATFTRPPGLPKAAAVPEDYAEYQPDGSANRAWFLVRPIDHQRQTADARSVLLVVQPRPPETDLDLAAGQYAWEAFQPQGFWKAAYIFLPRPGDAPVRTEAAGSTFVALDANRDHRLRLVPAPGYQTVAPTLIYHFPDTLSRLDVSVDGRADFPHVPGSSLGQVTLPDVPDVLKPHEISIRCNAPVRLWMNRVEPTKAEVWSRYLAVRFQGSSLEFDYPKILPGREVLVLRVFRRTGVENRLRLNVLIEGNTLSRTWVKPVSAVSREHTIRQRVFDIAPGDGPHGLLMGTEQAPPLDSGQSCMVPFGSDLPPGNYKIRVERADFVETDASGIASGTDVYLVVYRITPGAYEQRKISIESSSTATDSASGANDAGMSNPN